LNNKTMKAEELKFGHKKSPNGRHTCRAVYMLDAAKVKIVF